MSAAHRRLALRAVAAAAGAASLAAIAPAAAAGIEIGSAAPELDLRLLNGKVLKGKQLRGKVVVQMYWATWCPYCRADLPEMQRVYQQYNARGLEIVALSIDESEKTARDFWKGKHYTFPSGMRSNVYFQHYGRIGTTPTYVIIDRGAPEPGVIEQLVAKLL
jgi:thiol-disulfide isomerase/thioredoxin